MDRYETWMGRDEVQRGIELEINRRNLVTREEAQRLIKEAMEASNRTSQRRWFNFGVPVSQDPEAPGSAEHEAREMWAYLRDFFIHRDEFRKLMEFVRKYYENRDRDQKVWAHLVDQYEDEQHNKGAGWKNAGVIATCITAVVGFVSVLAGLWGHIVWK